MAFSLKAVVLGAAPGATGSVQGRGQPEEPDPACVLKELEAVGGLCIWRGGAVTAGGLQVCRPRSLLDAQRLGELW